MRQSAVDEVIIGSVNGLLPVWHQVITQTNADEDEEYISVNMKQKARIERKAFENAICSPFNLGLNI